MTTDGSDEEAVEARARLTVFAEHLAERLGPDVVHRGGDPARVLIDPPAGGCPVDWIYWGDTVIFGVGRGSCRWELECTLDDVAFIEAVVDAAIAGRVTEVFGLQRSEVTVTLIDGSKTTTAQATAPLGCLPIPRRQRNLSRRVHYSPYA